MKLACPNNEKHQRFTAIVLIEEEWTVDETGELLDWVDSETVSDPEDNPDSIWGCAECGCRSVLVDGRQLKEEVGAGSKIFTGLDQG
tara:strand:- start:976 stop:1236 length:261 start_codon:yes stop_codon:yes gene_type:complete